MPGIVVVGSLNADLVVRTARIPGPGETVLGHDLVMASGGKGGNQAVAAARAGATARMAGCVGKDPFGDQLVRGLDEAGIDISSVDRTGKPTGVALIWVTPTGENRIVVAPGANGQVSPDRVRSWSSVIQSADLVMVQLEISLAAVEEVMRLARAAGVRVMLDPAPVPATGVPRSLIQGAFFLTPNSGEASALTGMVVDDPASAARAARDLRNRGAGAVLVTLGAQGVILSDGDGSLWFSPFGVDPRDETAAGDAFNGVLGASIVAGLPLRDAVRGASAAGALASTVMGAQPSLPTRARVEEFLAERRDEGWPENMD